MDITNKERLASIEKSIEHIDKNIGLIAKNNINQWKQINKNAQNIAGIKGAAGAISFVVSILSTMIMGFLTGKIKQ